MPAVHTKRHFKLRRRTRRFVASALILLTVSAGLIAIHAAQTKPAAEPAFSNPQVKGIALGQTFVYQPPATSIAQLKAIKKAGFSSVRFVVSWYDIQPLSKQQFKWQRYDTLFNAIHDQGLTPLAIISFTPEWARSAACTQTAYCPPADPNAFATFAATVAKRYEAKGLNTYEIWNEENISGFWKPVPSAKDYFAVLAASYKAIKKVNPSATVIVGGMSDVSVGSATYLEPRDYLSALYKLGVKDVSDAIGYHPYTFPQTPTTGNSNNGWAKMDQGSNNLRAIMAKYNDSHTQIWLTEYGAPTGGPGELASSSAARYSLKVDHVTDTIQAEMAKQARSQLKQKQWIGSLYWYTWQDKSTKTDSNENFYGLVDFSGIAKPALNALTND